MVKLYAKHENAHEVQLHWRKVSADRTPTIRAILNTVRKFDKTGSVQNASRSGRPVQVLTGIKLAQIESHIRRKPDLSVSRGAAASNLPETTYRRALHQLSFKVYHPQLVAELSDDDFDRRKEFCELCLS